MDKNYDIIHSIVASHEVPVSVVDLLIREQLRNEDLFRVEDEPSKIPDLVEALARQTPHRLYYGANGFVLRALFFRGHYPHELFLEVLRFRGQDEKRVNSEFCSGKDEKALEAEIRATRRLYGIGPTDLLTQPDQAFYVPVDEPVVFPDGYFVHVGLHEGTPVIAYSYIVGPVGPRSIDITTGADIVVPPHAEQRVSPPEEMLTYAL